jgi:hypothetical protein
MSRLFTGYISEDECIGDSLGLDLPVSGTINGNFYNLDTSLNNLSATTIPLLLQYNQLKISYNTLLQSLTSIGAPGTTYTSLSTTFRNLSAFILP